MRFCYARSSVVTVREFNEEVKSTGNKSTVLFNNCARLISGLWNLCNGNIRLIVDKQEGYFLLNKRQSFLYLESIKQINNKLGK